MSFRKKPEDFNLTDLFQLHSRNLKLDFNCHAVGIIESFDSSNQTVSAKIAYQKTFFERRNEEYVPIKANYPLILDAPVVVLSGGEFSLKMPIVKGDECLVLFNDRSIDAWFNSGGVRDLESNRLHSFSDGIVLVGIRSMPKVIEGFEDNKVKLGDETHDLILGNGESTLKMNESLVSVKEKIKIENNSKNLNDLLQQLIAEIASMTFTYNASMGAGLGSTTVVSMTPPPDNASNINSIASEIGELLE